MASVYILYSQASDKFYIGSCLKLSDRLEQHSNKSFKEAFTAKTSDWKFYLSIDDLSYKQSRDIEAHIKRMKSKDYIQNLLLYPEIITKLKERYR